MFILLRELTLEVNFFYLYFLNNLNVNVMHLAVSEIGMNG